jgi:hypothetical protein
MSDVTLSPAEIQAIAGGYKRPGDQLRELHRQGFHRARLGRVTGQVILERAHYDAVCAGAGKVDDDRPHVRPTLRAVT